MQSDRGGLEIARAPLSLQIMYTGEEGQKTYYAAAAVAAAVCYARVDTHRPSDAADAWSSNDSRKSKLYIERV